MFKFVVDPVVVEGSGMRTVAGLYWFFACLAFWQTLLNPVGL